MFKVNGVDAGKNQQGNKMWLPSNRAQSMRTLRTLQKIIRTI